MSKGFIKLNRDIRGTWIHKNPLYFRAYCDILMTVNYTEAKTVINGKTLVCGVDESLLSLESWAQLFGNEWNKGKVRRFFDRLKKEHEISTIPDTKTTRLKVLGSARYRGRQHDNSTIIARYPTPIEEGKKERSITQREEPTEPMPLGIDEARQVIEETFGKGSKQIKALIERYKQNTGHSITETRALVGVSSFLQKGMVENYKGKIKRPDQVVPKLMAWLGNQMTFDYARKAAKADAKTDKTLNEYLKENYREKEYKRLDIENLNELYKKHEFFFKNITKAYKNPTITPHLLLELCYMPFGNKIGGNTPERKINAFKRFHKSLSSYNQNKGDIRKLLTEWKSKGQN